jgi:zinc/manganese transport system ATP-binding protein
VSVTTQVTPGPADQVPAGPGAVALHGVAARVGGRTLFHDVDLDLREGEFVALLGPNGAGKSTLIKMLLGLHPVAAGRIEVLGTPPGRANAAIGYLPQRRAFDSSTRVRGIDLVRLGLDGHRWGVPLPWRRWTQRGKAATARVEQTIALVGADAYARRGIGELSGGEQQRLLIAQALVRRPRLLLLDEPLDSLDLPNQQAIAALVAQICHTEHVTVIMVAHDVNPILTHLDRAVYLGAAGVVAGRPEQVITSEALTRLYGVPIEVLRAADGRLVVVGQPDHPAAHTGQHGGDRRG